MEWENNQDEMDYEINIEDVSTDMTSMNIGTCIENLPPEILSIIFSFLNPEDITLCSMVSRRWRDVSLMFRRENLLNVLRLSVIGENMNVIKFITSLKLETFFSDYYFYIVSVILGEEGSIKILRYFNKKGYSLREAYIKCMDEDRLEEFKWILSKNCVEFTLIDSFRYVTGKKSPKIFNYIYSQIASYDSFPEGYILNYPRSYPRKLITVKQ